jgi:hypothetical protein
MFDELSAAMPASEQSSAGFVHRFERLAAFGAALADELGFDDQPELGAAPRTTVRVRHIHVKAATAAHGRNARAAKTTAHIPGLRGGTTD